MICRRETHRQHVLIVHDDENPTLRYSFLKLPEATTTTKEDEAL